MISTQWGTSADWLSSAWTLLQAHNIYAERLTKYIEELIENIEELTKHIEELIEYIDQHSAGNINRLAILSLDSPASKQGT